MAIKQMIPKKLDLITRKYRNDVKNLTLPLLNSKEAVLGGRQRHFASENLAEILTRLKTTLAVSLEYEHTLVLVYAKKNRLYLHYLEIPHPSGIFFDGTYLTVSSTRSPNQLLFFRALPKNFRSEILPSKLQNLRSSEFKPQESRLQTPLLLPVKSLFLPGQFSVHDVVKMGEGLYVVATGVNFVARVSAEGGFERVWHPKCLDRLGKKAFTTNYLQLNSIARGRTLRECFFTGFSDQPTQAKPWKTGYGPKHKGVVFEGSSRETIYRGLTCPHSIRRRNGKLWLCDSGMGEVGILDPKRSRYTEVAKLQGFTRGLTFLGPYAIVGISKVIPKYEPYAPGLDPRKSQCGIAVVNLKTGSVEATLIWKNGFQVYDVQTLDGLTSALLPANSEEGLMNYYLTYYGWDSKWNHQKKISQR